MRYQSSSSISAGIVNEALSIPWGWSAVATVPKASLRCHRMQAVGTDNKIKSARSRLLEVDQDAVASAVIVPSNR
jgi:hypothetical protein